MMNKLASMFSIALLPLFVGCTGGPIDPCTDCESDCKDDCTNPDPDPDPDFSAVLEIALPDFSSMGMDPATPVVTVDGDEADCAAGTCQVTVDAAGTYEVVTELDGALCTEELIDVSEDGTYEVSPHCASNWDAEFRIGEDGPVRRFYTEIIRTTYDASTGEVECDASGETCVEDDYVVIQGNPNGFPWVLEGMAFNTFMNFDGTIIRYDGYHTANVCTLAYQEYVNDEQTDDLTRHNLACQ